MCEREREGEGEGREGREIGGRGEREEGERTEREGERERGESVGGKTTECFLGEKWPQRGIKHSSNLAPRLKKQWSYTYTLLLGLHGLL
jgi:hypothetical protein